MSFLEFPINKFRSSPQKKYNDLLNHKPETNLNEETKPNQSKIFEEECNEVSDFRKIDVISSKEGKNLDKENLKNTINKSKEKFKFTTNLSKHNLSTNNKILLNNYNNNFSTNLMGELNKNINQVNPKRNFLVALKDFESMSTEKQIVVNFGHNEYYKNMMNYKVRNDVNQLINAKNEKEMFKKLNSGTQFKFFSSTNRNLYKDKEKNNLCNTEQLFYNHSTKDMQKNLNINKKRFSMQASFINFSNYFSNNLKKNYLVNTSDSINKMKNTNNNFFQNEAKMPNIKQLILAINEKKEEDSYLIDKNLNDLNVFPSGKLSLDKVGINLKSDKNIHNLNNNKRIRGSINLALSSEKIFNSNHKFKLQNNRSLSQDSCSESKVLYSTNKNPFGKKENLSSKTNNQAGFTNRNIRNVGYISNLKEIKKKKASINNNFFKNNEIERDFMKESNYFDKQSNFNSTQNGFSTSEKNFRTTLESYMPRKNKIIHNDNNIIGNTIRIKFI